MESDNYRSPEVEIIEMQAEQAILSSSFTGEDINDWEDMQNNFKDYEKDIIYTLAYNNGIRFYFLYNQSDEVLEAGQQRLKWISIIKEEYKTENIVEWLISSLKNEDLLRRYMETNQTLMWNIKDYLMGIY